MVILLMTAGYYPLLVNMREFEFYDVNKTLSRQRLFNFVLGGRGMGKTYSSKKRAVDNFFKKREQFVYIRRFETDLKPHLIRNFFSDIEDAYPEHTFAAGNGLFKIDGEIAGWYIPLSTAARLKSIPFPYVSLIIFDEFVVESGLVSYIPNEVRCFLECYSTISRDRDIQVLFLSNAITMGNPYFAYFEIAFEEGQTLKLTPFICVELVRIASFEKHMKQTKFGKMISGTAYGDYNIENHFLLDTNTFIEKMSGPCVNICTFVFNGKRLGYFSNSQTGLFYLSDKYDPSNKRVYTLAMNNHDVDTTLAIRVNPFISSLVNSYCEGKLRFTSLTIKNLCIPNIKRLL